ALTEEANRALAERFRVHDVERVYLAVLRGLLRDDELTVDVPVAGRRALTRFSVVTRIEDPGATLVRCRLETGRPHQLLPLGSPPLPRRGACAPAFAPAPAAPGPARRGAGLPAPARRGHAALREPLAGRPRAVARRPRGRYSFTGRLSAVSSMVGSKPRSLGEA